MKGLKKNAGMTLVETIVAGLIALVIASVIFTMFSMYDSQTRESTAYAKLQRQYENVAEQIAFDTRRASRVVQSLGEWTSPFAPLLPETTLAVIMCDNTGAQIAGYSFANGQLQEWDGSPKGFQAGGGVVEIDTSSSYFVLNAARDRVEARLRLRTQDRDSTYYFGPLKDAYTCRNQKLL